MMRTVVFEVRVSFDPDAPLGGEGSIEAAEEAIDYCSHDIISVRTIRIED